MAEEPDRRRSRKRPEGEGLTGEVGRAERVAKELRQLVDVANLHVLVGHLERRVAELEAGQDRAAGAAAAAQQAVRSLQRSQSSDAAIEDLIFPPERPLPAGPRVQVSAAASVHPLPESFYRPGRQGPRRPTWRGSPYHQSTWLGNLEQAIGWRIVGPTTDQTLLRIRRLCVIGIQGAVRDYKRWAARNKMSASWVRSASWALRYVLLLAVAISVARHTVIDLREFSRQQYNALEALQVEDYGPGGSGEDPAPDLKAGYILDDLFEEARNRDFKNLGLALGHRSPFLTYASKGAPIGEPAYLKEGGLNSKAQTLAILGLNARFSDAMEKAAQTPSEGEYLLPERLGFSYYALEDMANRGQCYPLSNIADQAWRLASGQHGPRTGFARSYDFLYAVLASDFRSCTENRRAFLLDLGRVRDLQSVEFFHSPDPDEDRRPLEETSDDADPADAQAEDMPIRFWALNSSDLASFAIERTQCGNAAWRASNGNRAATRAYLLGVIAMNALDFDDADACFASAQELGETRLAHLAAFMRGRAVFWRYAYGAKLSSPPEGEEREAFDWPVCRAGVLKDCFIAKRSLDDLAVMFSTQDKAETISKIRKYAAIASEPAFNGDLVEYIQLIEAGDSI